MLGTNPFVILNLGQMQIGQKGPIVGLLNEYDDSVRVLGTNPFVILNLGQMQNMSIGSNSWIAEWIANMTIRSECWELIFLLF